MSALVAIESIHQQSRLFNNAKAAEEDSRASTVVQPRWRASPFSLRKHRRQTNTPTTPQPFSLYSAGFFVLCGFGLYYYFTSEKDRLNRKRVRDASKGYGKPRIGGEFELIDQHGKKFGSEDMKGKFALVGLAGYQRQQQQRS